MYAETNKKDWKYQARLNDTNTDSQTAWPTGCFFFLVAGGSNLHNGQTSKGFLILENVQHFRASIKSWVLVSVLTVQRCVTELIVTITRSEILFLAKALAGQ